MPCDPAKAELCPWCRALLRCRQCRHEAPIFKVRSTFSGREAEICGSCSAGAKFYDQNMVIVASNLVPEKKAG